MTKATYQKPTIIRHQGGLSQKFGRPTRRASMERIDGVPVEELMEKYGSPLFVFSERTIRERYRQAHRAFSIRYPKVQFAWSYKTNYIDAICRIYHQEGSWAEVVSDMEYDMARRLGVPGNQILFNGPLKTEEALRRAFKEGAHVHIDHYDELYMAEQVAKEFDEPVPVAIRVNMDTGIY
ncbi:diaminopimelate decarboxylase, partial [bacterium]|nr:diaminopimelate decarboxylase [bacterium]